MLYYHDGSPRIWHKVLTALESKMPISIAKFRKLSLMVWGYGYIFSKGVRVIRILNEIMSKEVYLDNLEHQLISSIKKFCFINRVNPNKFPYKYYQGNDPKYKSHLCKS